MKSDIYNHILIELSFTELGLVKDNTWNWEQGRNMGLEYATFYFDIGVTLSAPVQCSTRFMICSHVPFLYKISLSFHSFPVPVPSKLYWYHTGPYVLFQCPNLNLSRPMFKAYCIIKRLRWACIDKCTVTLLYLENKCIWMYLSYM